MHDVPPRYRIHGHAIVSVDDKIADAAGRMPRPLRNTADWRNFQRAMDAAAVVVLGRLGHEAHPDASGRNRIVVTRARTHPSVSSAVTFWNPVETPLAEVLEIAAPAGGTVVVPGGQGIFDLFLQIGYDEFHLARANRVTLGEGTSLFAGVDAGTPAEELLREAGLAPGPTEMLDPAEDVTLAVWRPAGAQA